MILHSAGRWMHERGPRTRTRAEEDATVSWQLSFDNGKEVSARFSANEFFIRPHYFIYIRSCARLLSAYTLVTFGLGTGGWGLAGRNGSCGARSGIGN